jgi:hypothetical protein
MVSQGYSETWLYSLTLRQLEFYCEKRQAALKRQNDQMKKR